MTELDFSAVFSAQALLLGLALIGALVAIMMLVFTLWTRHQMRKFKIMRPKPRQPNRRRHRAF